MQWLRAELVMGVKICAALQRGIRSQRKKQNPTSLIPPAQRNFYNRFCPELKTHSERPQAPLSLRGRRRANPANFFFSAPGDAPKPLGDYTHGTTLRRTARILTKQTLPTRKGVLRRTNTQPSSKRLCLTLNPYGQNAVATRRIGNGCNYQQGNTLPAQKTKPDFSHPPCPKKLLQPVLSRAKNAFRTPPSPYTSAR